MWFSVYNILTTSNTHNDLHVEPKNRRTHNNQTTSMYVTWVNLPTLIKMGGMLLLLLLLLLLFLLFSFFISLFIFYVIDLVLCLQHSHYKQHSQRPPRKTEEPQNTQQSHTCTPQQGSKQVLLLLMSVTFAITHTNKHKQNVYVGLG